MREQRGDQHARYGQGSGHRGQNSPKGYSPEGLSGTVTEQETAASDYGGRRFTCAIDELAFLLLAASARVELGLVYQRTARPIPQLEGDIGHEARNALHVWVVDVLRLVG